MGSKKAAHQLAFDPRTPLRSTYVDVVALPSTSRAFGFRSALLLLALALIGLPDCQTLTGVDDLQVVESSDAGDGSDARQKHGGSGGGSTLDGGSVTDGSVVTALSGGAGASVDAERCVPSCEDKECGDDGCEGSCGECGSRQRCHDGECGSKR